MTGDDPGYTPCGFEWPVGEGPPCPGWETHCCYVSSTDHTGAYGCARTTHRCLCGEVTS